MDTLVPGLRVTHQMLVERLDLAAVARPTTDPAHPRDQYPAIDTFLASASRHNAATLAAIVPAVRSHVPDGADRVHEYVAAEPPLRGRARAGQGQALRLDVRRAPSVGVHLERRTTRVRRDLPDGAASW